MNDVILAMLAGFLVACGTALLLHASASRLLLGLLLLGNGINLAVFSAAGTVEGHAPLIPADRLTLEPGAADPLPQALVLTAIVIGFGVTLFAGVLALRVTAQYENDQLDLTEAPDEVRG